MEKTIRIEQVIYNINKKQRIEIAVNKFNVILRVFTKSPLMQMLCFNMFEKLLKLSEPIMNSEFSNYILNEIDELEDEFKKLEKSDLLISMRKAIKSTIIACDTYGIDLSDLKNKNNQNNDKANQ